MNRWQSLCLESDAPWIVPHVINFVKSQGRMKFVRPLYRALHQSAVGTGIARSTFIENNEMYAPSSSSSL
jgi:leukotriene-A4 hydrolase